jgi:hypothetical protein
MLLSEEHPQSRIDAVDLSPRLIRGARKLQKREFKSTFGKVNFKEG